MFDQNLTEVCRIESKKDEVYTLITHKGSDMVVLTSRGNLYHYIMSGSDSQLKLSASYYREGSIEIKESWLENVFAMKNDEIGDISAMKLLEDTIIMTYWNSEKCKWKSVNNLGMLLKRIDFRNKNNFWIVEKSIKISKDKIYTEKIENNPKEKEQWEALLKKPLEDSLKFYQFSIVSFEVVNYNSDFKYLLCGTDNGKLISFNFRERDLEPNMELDKDPADCMKKQDSEEMEEQIDTIKGHQNVLEEEKENPNKNFENEVDEDPSVQYIKTVHNPSQDSKKEPSVLENMRVTTLGNNHVYLHKMGHQEDEKQEKVSFYL